MRQIRLEVLDHPIDVIGADVAALVSHQGWRA